MALTTNGLSNGGATIHYQFQYDDSLTGGLEPARTNQVIAAAEADFIQMTGWFGGTALDVNFRIAVNVTQNGGGASWSLGGGNLTVTINPATGDQAVVRYLMVAEMVEQFMRSQGRGWFGAGTEGSEGEGLSRFLAAQFLAINNLGSPPSGFGNSNAWLASSRADYVNNINRGDDGPDAITGCSLLFIYYLFSQLGFGINAIVGAGANTLGGVYRNLTGDSADPFPFFKQIADMAYPGTMTITSGNIDNPFPILVVRSPGNFDGDLQTDFGVWRPGQGEWYVIDSSSGAQQTQQWGTPGDIPVPGDYDGDGKTDYAVWRPSNGTWYVIYSSDGTQHTQQWGTAGDYPTPGDYDGDGKADFAVWRPGEGNWYVILSSNGTQRVQQWGTPGDIPVPGDYDGDGKTDFAVWRPSQGNWYVIYSSNGAVQTQQWGTSGDIPVPGDYDGDGKTDFAVWRPSQGNWYIIYSSSGTQRVQQWGTAGDFPVPGDYDGDTKTDFAVWRPSQGEWYVINSSSGAQQTQQWGTGGDIPA